MGVIQTVAAKALASAACCAKALNHEIFLPGIFDKLCSAVFLHAFLLMTGIAHNEGEKLQPAPRKIWGVIFLSVPGAVRLG